MIRLWRYFEKLKRFARLFSWRQLVLFKLNDLLVGWVERPSMRKIRALRLFARTVPPEELTVDNGLYRFRYEVNDRAPTLTLRAGSSDVGVFLQVFEEGEYRDVVQMVGRHGDPPRIIDAGANVGLTTLYFKCFRPDARIVALEPEPGNFQMLSRCVRENGLRHVTLLNEGLWTRDAELAPDRGFRDGEAWSFALREAAEPGGTEPSIPAISLSSLVSRVGWSDVDLMKIDVEGTEGELIRDADFLRVVRDRVKLVAVEIHEEAITREEAQRAFGSIGFDSVLGGETLVAWRARPPERIER